MCSVEVGYCTPSINWQCPRCQNELGELNGWCEYCKHTDGTIVYNPDNYLIRDIRIRHITNGAKTVTPQEELFKELFNSARVLVKDMSTLELRAKREEWAKIAFEARAYLTAADAEENDRKKLSEPKGPKGFQRSVNTDETTTNAINTLKERKARMSKAEKVQESLKKLYEQSGMSAAEAEKEAMARTTAGNILAQIKNKGDKKSEDIITGQTTHSPLSSNEGFVINKPPSELAIKPDDKPKAFVNPFEKK